MWIYRIVRATLRDIGYTDSRRHGLYASVLTALEEQSSDIALGVDRSSNPEWRQVDIGAATRA